jgi:serine/threonine protein kinase
MGNVTLTVKKTGQTFRMVGTSLRVGRGAGNQLLLRSRSASRQHAFLEREGDCAWITDLSSRNGTFVNGKQLEPNKKTALTTADEVRFGQSIVLVIRGCAVPIPPTRPYSSPPPGKRASSPANNGYGQPAPFGFKPNRVEFAAEGVAAEAAAALRERFRPITVVSSGGMGKILLVQEMLSGRFVAMKVMLKGAMYDKSLVQQFVREAVITARLQHPHIIPVHDLGFLEGNQLYYTMSYIESIPLRKLLSSLELLEKIRILRCASLAVSYAHSKGLWHRDLKPQNILVGPLGDTYVIDWGLVSVQPGKEYKLNIPKIVVGNMELVVPDNLIRETADAITAQSGEGRAIGTPMYMPPEQLNGDEEKMGTVSDVWAFGVMLFEALTGIHPLRVDSPDAEIHGHELAYRILYERLPAPSEVNPSIPEELDRLCQRLLEKDPNLRPPDLGEFLETTTRFLRQQAYAVSSFGNPQQAPPSDAGAGRRTIQANQDVAALAEENARLRAELERLRGRAVAR